MAIVRVTRMQLRLAIMLLFFVAAPVALAKHGRAPLIEPIVRDGIRYVVPNDKGRHAYVQAWDTSTDRKIWTVTVFRRLYVPCPFLGTECMYFEYLQSMQLEDGHLILTSERGRRFSMDLRTRAVRRIKARDPNQITAGNSRCALRFRCCGRFAASGLRRCAVSGGCA
jgi:hypothetical protein